MRAYINVRAEPVYRRAAIVSGLQRVGFTIVDKPFVPEGPRDFLVSWNRKNGADEHLCEAFERRGGTVLVLENGYLQKVDKTYYAISVHQHNGAGWWPSGDEDRFGKLGFEVKPWRTDGREICIRLQRGIGSRLMASPMTWPRTIAKRVSAAFPGKPLRVIPHPGNFKPKVEPGKDLADASALVIWCSAMGVRALVEGVPVFYDAPHWVCASAGARLGQPANVDGAARAHALHRMSWNQWHHEEIAAGEPFARILEGHKC